MWRIRQKRDVYLVDTDVISEVRKRENANPGVIAFFRETAKNDDALYISVITIGELRRGVEIIRRRGDNAQAGMLEQWLTLVLRDYADRLLSFDAETAQVWGRLRVPHPENPLDKQIAATALIHDLTLVTRNVRHFEGLGLPLLNPFQGP